LLLSMPRRLVSSHNHVRDSLLRGFPRDQAAATRHRAVPSCRWRLSPPPGCPDVQLLPSRLQGVDPGCDPLRVQTG
jgi:hypothetical protein